MLSLLIIAVLSGVVDVVDDDKLKQWLKIILSALKNHISEPAVQVIYCSPSYCTVSHTHSDWSMPLLNTDASIKARCHQMDWQ